VKTSLRRCCGTAAVLAVAGAIVAAATIGGTARSASAEISPTPSSGCHLANGIKHVIEITFDNVHYNRDNPNVLSDLEQMPALLGFVTGHGTLLSNNHTPLIAHTADDSLTLYTGLYGDRHGQGLTNTYETYGPDGTVTPKSSFAYWTDTYGLDAYPNMPYSANVPALGAPPKTPPAPWVPFTRAGCDVGDVSTANMVLENLNPDLAKVFGADSPEVGQLNADPNSFKDQETNDYLGLGVHCAQGDSFCSTAQAVKFGRSSASPTAVDDVLPDEPGGYSGFQALFGHRYLQPQLAQAANSGGNRVVNGHTYKVVDSNGNLVDLNGNTIVGQFTHTPGFPGFGPISAAQSLAYVADMQETGVPITYAYISDAHERKPGQSGCSNSGTAQGPGDTCYKQNLAAYNDAFATFFQRLADDGMDASNTLLVVSTEEDDHFAGANAGRAVQPTCTGTPGTISYTCSYPSGTIGEEQVAIHGLLQAEFGDTIPFYNEPQGNSVFITGKPGPTDGTTRQLEHDFLNATAYDTYDAAAEPLVAWAADPEAEQLLHFVDADPNRTPSFTVFPRPDFFLNAGTGDNPACAAGTTQATAPTGCTSINNGFAWNHGYYNAEIDNDWVAFAGPGVAQKGVDGLTAAQGPSSADGANADPKLVTDIENPGTWADETDVRPTLLALVGFKDDYVEDGRVLTEDLAVTPGATGDPRYLQVARCYKQLNASVGQFGTDVLVADTAALRTGSGSGDTTYKGFLAALTGLGTARDSLASRIKQDLFHAAFDGTTLGTRNVDLPGCLVLLHAADGLAKAAAR
jgi:hypothetical protein